MRWIPLFALIASLASVAYGAEADASADATAAEEEPVLEGVVVERTNGGYLTLTTTGTALVVRFFDEKKKPVAADATRGFVRFQFPNRKPERRPLILSEDGLSLSHGEPVRQPHIFKAFVTLVHGAASSDGGDSDGESGAEAEKYVVDYR